MSYFVLMVNDFSYFIGEMALFAFGAAGGVFDWERPWVRRELWRPRGRTRLTILILWVMLFVVAVSGPASSVTTPVMGMMTLRTISPVMPPMTVVLFKLFLFSYYIMLSAVSRRMRLISRNFLIVRMSRRIWIWIRFMIRVIMLLLHFLLSELDDINTIIFFFFIF